MLLRSLALGAALSGAIATAFWYMAGWAVTYPAVLCSWLVGVNVVAFAYYAFDKRQAVRLGRRVPETTLLTLAAAGGSLGAFAGMRFFRHKTIKGSFRALYWLIVIAQLLLIAWAARLAFWAE